MSDGMKLPDYWYTPYFSKYASKSEMKILRAEYSRLRDIAQKRLGRLYAAGFTPREFRAGVPKLKAVSKNSSEFGHAFSALYNFLQNPESRVSGAKKTRTKVLESLWANDMTYVTEENLPQFGAFMELYRLSGVEKVFNYNALGEAFQQVTEDVKGKSRKSVNKKIEKAFRAYLKAEYGFTFRIKKEDRPAWL